MSERFILSVFDRELWCDVLMASVEIQDLDRLRLLLSATEEDPELLCGYTLEAEDLVELGAITGRAFDFSGLGDIDAEYCFYRLHPIRELPYLVHTGYELFLLLEGRKKIAKMYKAYPPKEFPGEHRFEHWVAEGFLHREEVLELIEHPKYEGIRTVYYTPIGEEWRIPAMESLRQAAEKSGGWNEYYERLESMLFGYEDWETDWWIENGNRLGGIGGMKLCCTVTEAGLAWLEIAGYRALPPIDDQTLSIAIFNNKSETEQRDFMMMQSASAALVVFNVDSRFMKLVNHHQAPWQLPADRIPQLNQILRRPIEVRMRRNDLQES